MTTVAERVAQYLGGVDPAIEQGWQAALAAAPARVIDLLEANPQTREMLEALYGMAFKDGALWSIRTSLTAIMEMEAEDIKTMLPGGHA